MLNFQEMIAKLTQFWVEQGCLVHQGYDLEVGAGTFNPATFLRALGPEPYAAVYVEPSRRPQDGRYGENPNRVQHYHQMQVIIKPSPPNILELYIDSLKSIGLKLEEHDIRFVHDDWENPTIGASGLGWEVWLDGMEITQFTYFQTIGGLPVRPVSGEITYGLERLAMYLQGVNSMFDIKWNDEITYGDIFKRSEWEWSHYNFDQASIEMWRKHFDDYENEAKKLIKESLPLPAYDFIMKASHAFNILEARGVISVTERTGYIGRIRALSKALAENYIAMRKTLNFPLLKPVKTKKEEFPLNIPMSSEKGDFLLEIGSEELPHSFVPIGLKNLETKMDELLKKHDLSYTRLKTYGTPRRLAIIVENLSGTTKIKTIEKKGPPITSAFDNQGNPTHIGEAFFRSLNSSPLKLKDLANHPIFSKRMVKDKDYLFALIEEKAKSTLAILQESLPELILSLNFPKKMRWASFDIEYPRPLRWLVALFETETIPFVIADVVADKITYGHRQIANRPITISSPKEYVSQLKKHHVMVDVDERRQTILDGLSLLEKSENIVVAAKEKVLPVVLHLVEWPFVLKGNFSPSYLKAPEEVLSSEMIEHQKYFPVKKNEKLLPEFVIVSNNFPSQKIKHGNERALAPRLFDGLFLYEQDLKLPLADYVEPLKRVTFQKGVGSLFAKTERLIRMVELLNTFAPLCELKTLKRAAFLSKADLVTELVKEFPDLQGIIGKHYASLSKEPEAVAEAILEHWMPRGENAPLPKTPCGVLLALSDKVDNLLSCFALGLIPTSSSDPYALRRQAVGIIKMIIENRLHVPFQTLFKKAFEIFVDNPELDSSLKKELNCDKIVKEIEEFFKSRLKTVFLDFNFQKDEIEAVLSKEIDDIYDTYLLLFTLHNFRKKYQKQFQDMLTVNIRTKKILLSQSQTPFPKTNPALFKAAEEKSLFDNLQKAKKAFHQFKEKHEYERAFSLLSELEPFLSTLFDNVTIVDKDPTLKQNRLGLLQEVRDLSEELLDFSKIQELN